MVNTGSRSPRSPKAPSAELDANEDLGRAVFSQRARDRARKVGRIRMDVFLEREQAESISVDRMKHATADELAEWSRERGRRREPPRQFQGWAVVKVRDAAANGRTVEATPTVQNRCHADILLNVTGEDRRRRQKDHAVELAHKSRWEEAPADPVDSNPG